VVNRPEGVRSFEGEDEILAAEGLCAVWIRRPYSLIGQMRLPRDDGLIPSLACFIPKLIIGVSRIRTALAEATFAR